MKVSDLFSLDASFYSTAGNGNMFDPGIYKVTHIDDQSGEIFLNIRPNPMFSMTKPVFLAELLAHFSLVSRDGLPIGNQEPLPPLKCECGVGFVGGIHSDWCPLAEK